MMDSVRQRQIESERWSQTIGRMLQAEVEKAFVQGLTAAFQALTERLPSLLADVQRQSAASPLAASPCIPRIPFDEPETTEHPAAMEITAFDSVAKKDAESPQSARCHLRDGVEAERAGDLKRALTHFTEARRLDPSKATIHLARSRLLLRLGCTEEALADAEEALRLDCQLDFVYYLRAAIRMRRGDNRQAIADLTRFLEKKSDHALAYHARGLAYVNNGEYELAIGDFGRALRLRPKLLPARYQRALAYRLKGEYVVSILELTKILKMQPNFARAYYERALARSALEEHEIALEDFAKALELAPQDQEIRKRRERALQAWETSRPATPTVEENRREAAPRLSPVPRPTTPSPAVPANDDPTFLRLTCSGCGAAAKISWKRLDRLFRCRRCTRVFRVNREGQLIEIDPNPLPSPRSRRYKGGIAIAVVVAVLVLCAIWFVPRMRHKSSLPELPNDLQSRGELWAQAWLNDDRFLLRRLTSPTHDRQLHPWLTRHPTPNTKRREAAGRQDSSEPEIHLRVRKTKPDAAVVIVRIRAASWETPHELLLDWVARGDIWYFVPTLKR